MANSGTATGTIIGLNISSITGGSATETAISIGSGWDSYLNIATISTTTLINIQGTAGRDTLNISSSTGASMFYITNGARIGINSSTPAATLSVQGAAVANPLLIASSTGTVLMAILQNGNVGIGSASPITTLALTGTVGTNPLVVASSTGTQLLTILQNSNVGISSATPVATLSLQGTSGTNALFIASSTGTGLMIIQQNGNVGIGSSSPSTSLAIQGVAGSSDLFNIASSSGISVLRITATQRVGIGSTSPIATLAIQGTSTSPTLDVLDIASSTGAILFNVLANGKVGIGTSSPAQTLTLQGTSGTDLLNIASSTGASIMYIMQNGNVGIGTTTPAATLNVLGTGIFQSTTNTPTAFQVQNASGTPILLVDTTPTFGATTTNYIANPGFEVNTSGWAASGTGATIARVTTNKYMGLASLKIDSYGSGAGQGASTTVFTMSPTAGTYVLSFYARTDISSSSFSTLMAGYSTSTQFSACTLNSNTVSNLGWRRYNCSFTVSGPITQIFIGQSDANPNRTFYIDSIQLQLGSAPTPYAIGNIQLRGVITSPVSLQSLSNSVTAFQIQDQTGVSNLFIADTLNNAIDIGTSTGTSVLNIQGVAGSTNGLVSISSSTGASLMYLGANGKVGFGSSTPNATMVVEGATNLPTSDILRVASSSNAVFLNVTAAGNVGIGTTTPATALSVVGSITSTVLAGTANGIVYVDATGKLINTVSPQNLGVNQCLVSNNGGTPAWTTCTSINSTTTIWSSLANPTAALTVNMGSNTTNFTYGNTTGSGVNLFTFNDSANNTGTGSLFTLSSNTGSALNPFQVLVSSTTPALVVTAGGFAGFGTTTPTSALYILNSTTSLFSIASTVGSSLFDIRNIGVTFGAAGYAGAFVSKNSYFGEEYSQFHSLVLTVTTAGKGGTSQVRGQSSTLTANTAGNGTMTFNTNITATPGGCTATSTNALNGIETVIASSTVSTSASCMETVTTNASATLLSMFNPNNLPVVEIKASSTSVTAAGATQPNLVGAVFLGIGDTAVASSTPPNNGIVFTNCTNLACTATSSNWTGMVITAGTVNTVSCPAITLGKMALLRFEVASTSKVNFFAQNNVANGPYETFCGSVNAALPNVNMTVMMEDSSTGTNKTILDLDYFRAWQDDTPLNPANNPPSAYQAASAVPDLVTYAALSQRYPSSGDIPDGSLVSWNTSTSTPSVGLSSVPYDQHILGVTVPEGSMSINDMSGGGAEVAISGRASLQVSSENGGIEPGDYLTSSDIPGVAMKAIKAGLVIGRALTEFAASGTGSVAVQISPTYFFGDLNSLAGITQGTGNAFSQNLLTSLQGQSQQLLASATGSLSQIYTDRVAALQVVTPQLVSNSLMVNSIQSASSSDLSILLGQNNRLAILATGTPQAGSGQIVLSVNASGNLVTSGTLVVKNGRNVSQMYPVIDQSLEPGDIVALATSTMASGSPISGLVKASSSTPDVLGVIASEPGLVLSGRTASSLPVSLIGQDIVKVSLENGKIEPGDYLTLSAILPGYAMKAVYSGNVIGRAMAAATGTPATSTTTLLSSIQYGWQNINNTFVLGANDGQLANATSTFMVLSSASSTAATMLVNQMGSGGLLQLQQNGEDRLLIANDGSVNILASTTLATSTVLSVKDSTSTLFSINARGDAAVAGIIVIKNDTFAGSIATDINGEAQIMFSYDVGTGKPVVQLTPEAEVPVFAQVLSWSKDSNQNYTGFTIKTFGLSGAPVSAIVHYLVVGKEDGYQTQGQVLQVTQASSVNQATNSGQVDLQPDSESSTSTAPSDASASSTFSTTLATSSDSSIQTASLAAAPAAQSAAAAPSSTDDTAASAPDTVGQSAAADNASPTN